MNAQQHNRSNRSDDRSRRGRFRVAMLSAVLIANPGNEILNAGNPTTPSEPSPTNVKSTASVLKSVGIKFVTEPDSDKKSTSTANSLAIPQTRSSQPSETSSFVAPSLSIEPSRVSMTPINANSKPESTPKDTAGASLHSQPEVRHVPSVILNSLEPAPVVKMQPMLAGSDQNSAPSRSPQLGAVKVEMASVIRTLGNPDSQSPPVAPLTEPVKTSMIEVSAGLAGSEKSSIEKAPSVSIGEVAAVTQPAFVSPPSHASPTSALEPTRPPDSSSTNETKITSPQPTESPLLNAVARSEMDERQQVQNLDVSQSIASNHVMEETSRTPNVVRIPSMTLSMNKEKPELKVPQEIPQVSIPGTKVEIVEAPPATLSNQTDKLATSVKIESAAPQASAVLAEKADQDTHARPLAKTIATAEPSREVSRQEPAVVAIPASSERLVTNRYEPSNDTRSRDDVEAFDDLSEERSSTNIELVYRDVQNVKLSGIIEKISVEDESVCKAMLNESNSVMLLGVGRGKTQVKVWLTSDSDSKPEFQVIDVSVREAWAAASPNRGVTFADATQSVADLFPSARIAIRSHEDGSLTVFGRTDSDEQAKQIASLVRKMFLVPVHDRIAVASPK